MYEYSFLPVYIFLMIRKKKGWFTLSHNDNIQYVHAYHVTSLNLLLSIVLATMEIGFAKILKFAVRWS